MRMNLELGHLRTFVAIVEEGTFTDAAIRLGTSQASASRSLAALERALGVTVLRRTTREASLTPIGTQLLVHARRVLAEADELQRIAATGQERLRIGYAWSAVGAHTTAFQREWAAKHPDTDLQLLRINTPTAGLAEGGSDLAILRILPDDKRIESRLVGVESRVCAMAADDPWARRRFVRLGDLVERTVGIDVATGTTTEGLWPEDARPALRPTSDMEEWLNLIAAGRVIGVTAESTAAQHPRPGIVYRPVRDTTPIPVYVSWWRDGPVAAGPAVIELLSSLYSGAS